MKACRACYHIIGILVVLVWGATFVNSKVLLTHGMEAHEIFTLRFLIAYLCIWTISPRRLFADNWRDELFMLILGLTGGSLYFLTENWAVKISYVNNVAFIVCTAPLLTTILAILFVKDVKATPPLIGGSLLALARTYCKKGPSRISSSGSIPPAICSPSAQRSAGPSTACS